MTAGDTSTVASERIERCEACDRETPHEVGIALVVESPDDDSGFSREPYRITRCRACGTETKRRMNDA